MAFGINKSLKTETIGVLCSVCNSHSTDVFDLNMSVYRCLECTHQFTILPKDQQEPYCQEYFLKTHKNWFSCPDIALFDTLISKISIPSPAVLDIGCGQGAFLKRFYEKNKQATLYGIDLIKNNHSDINFIQADFDIHVFNRSFDVITGFMVVEHMNDPQAFVKKIYSLLKPNGIMILNTINSSGLLYNLANKFKIIGWRAPFSRLYDKHHLQHYSFISFEKLVLENNFEIIDHESHNFPFGAVDVPNGSYFLKVIYKIGIICVFGLSRFIGQGMNQTIICKKKAIANE